MVEVKVLAYLIINMIPDHKMFDTLVPHLAQRNFSRKESVNGITTKRYYSTAHRERQTVFPWLLVVELVP